MRARTSAEPSPGGHERSSPPALDGARTGGRTLAAESSLRDGAVAISLSRRHRSTGGRLKFVPEGQFIEAFVDTPLEVCEQRDSKECTRRRGVRRSRDSPGSMTPMKLLSTLRSRSAPRADRLKRMRAKILALLRQKGFIGRRPHRVRSELEEQKGPASTGPR
jgi:hypothetical protein